VIFNRHKPPSTFLLTYSEHDQINPGSLINQSINNFTGKSCTFDVAGPSAVDSNPLHHPLLLIRDVVSLHDALTTQLDEAAELDFETIYVRQLTEQVTGTSRGAGHCPVLEAVCGAGRDE